MKFRKATIYDCQIVTGIVQNSIEAIYPSYYPREVVVFFSNLHSCEHILADISNDMVYILEDDGYIVGTGSFNGNHITRVYVLPEFQGKGYGKQIVTQLEVLMSEYGEITLDASLPACQFYEHLGYSTNYHDSWSCENGTVLVYDVMVKSK